MAAGGLDAGTIYNGICRIQFLWNLRLPYIPIGVPDLFFLTSSRCNRVLIFQVYRHLELDSLMFHESVW